MKMAGSGKDRRGVRRGEERSKKALQRPEGAVKAVKKKERKKENNSMNCQPHSY